VGYLVKSNNRSIIPHVVIYFYRAMKIVRLFLLLAIAAFANGCASTHGKNPADPLESLNRGVYQFNDVVDKAIAKPVARGYNAVMPSLGKKMVSNFFSNLDDLVVTANDLLQFKFKQALHDGSRFIFNSTFGILGLFDIASPQLEKNHEDFGQTLGHWGVGNGPYVMLPFLGPSSLRDSVGLYADAQIGLIQNVDHIPTRNQLYLTEAIKTRSQLLAQEKLLDEAAIDRYAFIRDTYLLSRKSLVYDGNPPRINYDDEFDDEYDDFEEYTPTNKTIEPLSIKLSPSLSAPQEISQITVHRVWVTPR